MPLNIIIKKIGGSTTWHDTYALSFLLIVFLILNCITPPLQSPDEFDHIKRAYALGEGTILFKPLGNQSSGTEIDDGLLQYIALYDPIGLDPDKKVTATDIRKANELQWQNTKTFSATVATAYYFPLIYAPQALALHVSRAIGLSINQSYYLTRLTASLVVLLILAYAFSLSTPSPVTLALLAIPMTTYQLSSTSLDGIATALSVLLISIFLKLMRESPGNSSRLFWLSVVIFWLLASSRLQLLPLYLLFVILFARDKNKLHLLGSFVAVILVLAWIGIASSHTVDHRVPSSISSSQVALAYLSDPGSLVQVIWSTLNDAATLRGWFSSFLGMLGWLTAPFPGRTYIYLLAALLVIGALSFSFEHIKRHRNLNLLFFFITGCSVFLILFAMLTTWTPYPSPVIIGVQGRYFLIPALVLSYGLFPPISKLSNQKFAATIVCLAGFGVYCLCITIKLLLVRYYISP